jgi:hypothetical protein|nr:MAG TPA: hypothetical protein [Crassvirales sp.]
MNTLKDEAIVLIAKKMKAGELVYKDKRFSVGKMTKDQFANELQEYLSNGWEKHSIGFDMPAALVDWESKEIIKDNFFKAVGTLNDEELIAYELYIDDLKGDVDPQDVMEMYYGFFDNKEDYARHIIKTWDDLNTIPIMLSEKLKPEDVLEDRCYMSSVVMINGPHPEKKGEEVIYVFHLEGYI